MLASIRKRRPPATSPSHTCAWSLPRNGTVPGISEVGRDNISLVVGQEARANVSLKPGAVSESVTVEASAVQLDTDSSSVSQLISQKQVDQLPLNGRNFVSLLFIGAGAVQTNGEQGQMRQGEGNAISINGSRPTSNTTHSTV